MSIREGTGSSARCVEVRLALAAVAGVIVTSSASADVRTFNMNWGPGGSSGSVFISINTLVAGPTSSATQVTGWDLQIESSNSGNELKFNFPSSGPGSPTDPNPRYGLMRLPGTVTGGGGALSFGDLVQNTASFADSGPVSFGGGAGQWRLNSVNAFGFRFALNSSTNIFYGTGLIQIGNTPGQFTLLQLRYEDLAGAPIVVVPGPGVAVTMIAAAAVGRRRRRR
jgi:hypothetical protein